MKIEEIKQGDTLYVVHHPRRVVQEITILEVYESKAESMEIEEQLTEIGRIVYLANWQRGEVMPAEIVDFDEFEDTVSLRAKFPTGGTVRFSLSPKNVYLTKERAKKDLFMYRLCHGKDSQI